MVCIVGYWVSLDVVDGLDLTTGLTPYSIGGAVMDRTERLQYRYRDSERKELKEESLEGDRVYMYKLRELQEFAIVVWRSGTFHQEQL